MTTQKMPCLYDTRPCTRRPRPRTSIRALLAVCNQFPEPGAPVETHGRASLSPDIHLHVAAIAGCLKRTAANAITFQAGSIIVEARRLAVILLAIVAISYGQVSDLPPPDIIKTGSFLTCPRTGTDLCITWQSSPESPVQTHGRASIHNDCSASMTVSNGPGQPDRQLWDIPEAAGIILTWDCAANRLYVTDPNNYLTGHAIWYTVKIWRAK